MFCAGWVCHSIDIETAFLEADLEEPTFVEIPDGYEFAFGEVNRATTVWRLLKAMYGLVQAPRAFYETFRKILVSDLVGLKQSRADPCLYFRHGDDGSLAVVLTVHTDDCAICGTPAVVAAVKKAIASKLSIKDEGLLSKHLGLHYEWKDDGRLLIHQNDSVQEIVTKFGGEPGGNRSFPSPGYPGVTLPKHEGEAVRLTEYRSFVGKVLFAMKKTYPELANSVRELATHMDCPGPEQWKAVGRMVGFLRHEALHGLKFNVPKDLAIVGCVDSDFATNKDTRRSTSGYLVTLGGCLVSWSSKMQPSVTLSSTEAEYVAASLCATEIKFVSMLLDELEVEFPKPATMFEDNMGAIFIMKNDQVGQRTKHIDVKWHHVRDMIKGGDLVVVYIRSEDNPADILTKNTKEALFVKHALSMKKGVLLVGALDREDVVDMVERELVTDACESRCAERFARCPTRRRTCDVPLR